MPNNAISSIENPTNYIHHHLLTIRITMPSTISVCQKIPWSSTKVNYRYLTGDKQKIRLFLQQCNPKKVRRLGMNLQNLRWDNASLLSTQRNVRSSLLIVFRFADHVLSSWLVSLNSSSSSSMQTVRPLSSTIIINPFERLRPLDMRNEPRSSEESSLQIFDRTFVAAKQDSFPDDLSSTRITSVRPWEKAVEPVLDQADDYNDSSTSTTTSRSIHLPVEKQRGLSEIIRKRNSRCKVEDYKRSCQKPTALDEDEQCNRTLPTSKSDHELVLRSSQAPTLTKAHSVEIPIEIPFNNDKRVQKSIERLNVLLSTAETSEQPEISNP